MSLPRFVFLTVICLLPVAASLAGAAPVVTTFDAGLEGWIVTGDNAVTWNATGGNPGGCLSVNDLAIGDENLAVAPQSYLGDWSALDAGDTLEADVYEHLISGTVAPSPWIFRIAGPGGAAEGGRPAGPGVFLVRARTDRAEAEAKLVRLP